MLVLWALYYAVAGYPFEVVVGLMPAFVVGVTTPLWLRWGVNPRKLGTACAVTLLSALVLPAFHSGGVASFIAPWMLLLPYLVLVAASERSWVWLNAASALVMVGLAGVSWVGLLPASRVSSSTAVYLGAWLSAWAVLAVAVTVQQRLTRTALSAERAISASLGEEVQRHRLTQRRLGTAKDELVAAARVAGMAEVANGVLHNVGNGLNAVNVSVALLAERHAQDPTRRFVELAEKMEGGQVSPQRAAEYVRLLAGRTATAHEAHMEELQRLRRHVEHVNTVVQAQQAYARHGGLREQLDVGELVQDALLLVQDRLHKVAVHSERPGGVQVATDRHKVMQILLNLLTNAADAVGDVPSPQIRVRIEATPDGCRVFVHDNGPGIPPDVRETIFRHGFTTKASGHGFGLHASAVAAMELGGQLVAYNDPNDGGAVFELLLRDLRPAATDSPLGVRTPVPSPRR